jgi:opacity protein-like surface antigen
MRRIALLSMLLVLFAIPVLASSPPNYGALKLGGYFPQNSDMDNFDSGFNGEFALGHYFNPNVALELSIGYFKASGSEAGVDADITSYPILLSIKLVAPISGGELYALGGGGVYITDLDASAFGVNVSSDDNPFGFQLGVGGNFDISPNVFFGLEAKYFWAKPSFDLLGVTSVDVHIDGIQATANIGYRF